MSVSSTLALVLVSHTAFAMVFLSYEQTFSKVSRRSSAVVTGGEALSAAMRTHSGAGAAGGQAALDHAA